MISRRTAVKLTAAGLIAPSLSTATPPASAQSTGDWPMFGYNAARKGGPGPGPSLDKPIAVKWYFTTGDWVLSSPAVVTGVVYIGSHDGNVYALNAVEGRKRWHFATDGRVDSSPAVLDGVVYVGSRDGTVYALGAADGIERWRFATDGAVSSTAAVDGVIYVGSFAGTLHALNVVDGSERWLFTMFSILESSPAVVDGVVYFGNRSGEVFALNAVDGSEHWRFATDGKVFSSPAVVDGVVYFGSEDGNVYALGNLVPKPTVLTSDVVLRAAPGESSVERGKAKKGTELSSVGQREERSGVSWVEVAIGDITGWIPLDAIDPATLPPEGGIEYVYQP